MGFSAGGSPSGNAGVANRLLEIADAQSRRLQSFSTAQLELMQVMARACSQSSQARQFRDGKLILITKVPDLDAKEAVRRYKGLADIERGFRVLKSEIEIAPVHHRLPERIRAHTLICFLALVIHRVMRWRIKENQLPLSPEYVLEKLKTVQHHRVRLATARSSAASRRPPQNRGASSRPSRSRHQHEEGSKRPCRGSFFRPRSDIINNLRS
ncbi:MAG: IS1634 family transposase [Acidobacteria bacterium]|nr:IS1634 family transposase [Acidobacteriota bacterium]